MTIIKGITGSAVLLAALSLPPPGFFVGSAFGGSSGGAKPAATGRRAG